MSGVDEENLEPAPNSDLAAAASMAEEMHLSLAGVRIDREKLETLARNLCRLTAYLRDNYDLRQKRPRRGRGAS